MSTFTSVEYCSQNISNYEGAFEHDRGTSTIVVKEELISESVVASARARSELIKGGYAERWITIQSIFIPNLKQNDIITFKGINWIVKEITINFSPPVLTQTIKGLRYE